MSNIAKLDEWMQALGLLTTLCPTLVMDATDPIDMAKQIEEHVLAQRERAEAAEAALAAVPVTAIRTIFSAAMRADVLHGSDFASVERWLNRQPAVQP